MSETARPFAGFEGRVALITGASRRIGAALAAALSAYKILCPSPHHAAHETWHAGEMGFCLGAPANSGPFRHHRRDYRPAGRFIGAQEILAHHVAIPR